jgi:nucleoside-diphosphate-sugar epimerase
MRDGIIRVSNPAIWRPFLSIEDASMAYTRAVEADESISGIFNIASGNHTVGEIADLVKLAIEEELGRRTVLMIEHHKDVRNYKVSIERAKNTLSFHPHQDVRSIVRNLIAHLPECDDWDNAEYSNIRVFQSLGTLSTATSVAATGAA